MRRRIAAQAEIARCPHQAGAEVMQPDAIDQDARRQRIITIRNSASQLQAAAALTERLAFLARHYF